MRYGIDLDGVCFDFLNVFRKHLNKVFNIDLKEEEITSYYWYENTDEISKEDFFTEFHRFGRAAAYRTLPVLAGTLDSLERIQNAGHEIFYITNRPEYSRQDTIDALKKHGFPSRKNLFYTKGSKSSLIEKLNINVFIEDAPHNIIDIAHNTKAYVYCVDYPYNRKVEHHNIERIKDWDDFLLAEAI